MTLPVNNLSPLTVPVSSRMRQKWRRESRDPCISFEKTVALFRCFLTAFAFHSRVLLLNSFTSKESRNSPFLSVQFLAVVSGHTKSDFA